MHKLRTVFIELWKYIYNIYFSVTMLHGINYLQIQHDNVIQPIMGCYNKMTSRLLGGGGTKIVTSIV